MNESPNLELQHSLACSLEKAKELLDSTPGGFMSLTTTGVEISENFFPLLIREITDNESLGKFDESSGVWNFFRGRERMKFPCDMDTTSIALTVLPQNDRGKLRAITDEMLTYKDEAGIFQVYFDSTRPRVDPTVCANILTLFASCKRLSNAEVGPTLKYVREFLESRKYLPNGTRYYPTPEAFLYFVVRFVERSEQVMPQAGIGREWIPLLKERVAERIGAPCSPLSLAMRILLCNKLSIHDPDFSDAKSLLEKQEEDGGWKDGWLCGYPSTGVNIQNVGYTTSLAISALEHTLDFARG